MLACCTEFIHLISSESNEICNAQQKKTISAEHVLAALERLGYGDFRKDAEEVRGLLQGFSTPFNTTLPVTVLSNINSSVIKVGWNSAALTGSLYFYQNNTIIQHSQGLDGQF